MPTTRISARVSAISESATLAVDAKAKALKAAGRAGHRVRRRRARLPDPGYIVEAAAARLRRAAVPQVHPGRRPARAARGDRGQDRPRLRLPGDRGPGAGDQRRQAGRVPDVRHPARPGRRGHCAGPVLDDLPGGDRAGRRRARAGARPTRPAGYLASVERAGGGPDRADQAAGVRLPVQPDRRGLPARAGQGRSASGRPSTGIWVVTDEIYEHLVYGDASFSSIPVETPSIADRCVVLNGVAKTYAMTGWRVGWMIGPKDVDQGRDQPAEPRDLERGQRLPGGGARRRVRATCPRSARCSEAFDRRRLTIVPDAQRDPRRDLPRAAGRVLRLPERQGRARQGDRGASGRRPPPSWPTLILEQAEVAVVPGRGVRDARATSGCPTRWATPTLRKAWAGSASCCLKPSNSATISGCHSSYPPGGHPPGACPMAALPRTWRHCPRRTCTCT